MTNKEAAKIIREAAKLLAAAKTPEEAIEIVKPIRDFTFAHNHVGEGDKMQGSDEESVGLKLEWFGGAVLGIVDEKMWGMMPNWLKMVDEIVPEMD